ncbi:hypothetical protein BGX27_005274 [Mortierella sp. AM989]|nr:hypothetical protein BGX27_005274 [Mortierella sp. AM989]
MKRAEAAMSLQTSTQNGNAKYSWQRPYVRKWRKHLKRLERYLKANDAQRAIHVARILFQVRNGGAKLPNGSQLLMLVKMDEEHYVGSLEASAVEEMSSPKRQQQLERFTVKDLNSILERCVNLEDMGNGLNISLILLERYRSMSFNFQSEISVPNSRTIDLLLTILLKCGQTNKMEKLLSCLHVRYPHPIPIYVYISFLDKLAHIPFYINLMESLLGHLQRNGPAPTAALHNTFLKAHAFRSGAKRAGDYLKCMLERNYSADQQSFRILIEASLKELDLVRAHYWLGEYARQGYEIMPKMMVPFMKTCVQQIVNTQHDDPISENGLFTDTSTSSKEWMHKALHLVQFMTNQRIQPTARTFELLIEGFLSQGRLTDAKSVLNQMRGSPHLYNPTLKTWRLFFDYYLEVNNPSLALRILKQMRHELLLRPFKNTSAVVPTRLYHQFFRYLLQRGRLSRAESSLYEMMINQHRRQPTEREVADLIWKLDQHPEAAERVYELLYSQARKPGFSMTTIDPATKHFRKNRILENGPIQMANVGLMRARAISSNENLHREVWNAWNDMTEKFIEQHGLHSSSTQRHMPVLASAFEQVAIASRKSLLKSHAAKVKNQAIDMLEQEHNRTEGNRVASGWDFGRVRRNLGPGLGLGLGLDLSGGASVTSGMSRTLESKNKSQLLIQQLLQRKEVLKPLLDHQRVAESRGAALSTLSGTSDITAEADINDVRLRNLKSSFEWVQAHEIPIRIEGLNAYIASLLSHNEFDEAKACAERFFLSSAYTNSAVPEGKISSDSTLKTSPLPSFSPNVATIQLFYDQRSQISDEIVHRLLYKGGHKLVSEWNKCLKIPAPKIEPM